MWGYLLVAFIVAVGTMILTATMAATRRQELESQLLAERGVTRATRWLAQYNYAFMAAVQDVAARELRLSYAGLSRKVAAEMERQPYYGSVGQLIPLDKVPKGLLESARAYNERVFQHWPDEYTKQLTPGESPQQQRIRQLQDALHVALWDGQEFLEEEFLNRLARHAGTSYAQAEGVMRSFSTLTTREVDRVLGPPEPEELLPAVY